MPIRPHEIRKVLRSKDRWLKYPRLRRLLIVFLVGAQLAACTNKGANEGAGESAPATTITTPTSTTSTTTTTVPLATTTSFVTTTPPPCRTDDKLSEVDTYVYAEIPDIDPVYVSLDVYYPAGCGPFPVVVWVHGGGWIGGDKANIEVPPKARLVNQLGAALVSVNYRLTNTDARGQWPDHANDIASAVRFIEVHGPDLFLNPADLVLMGHSAGGHLVSIVATDPHYLVDQKVAKDLVDCVVALDTEGYRLSDRAAATPFYVVPVFGTDPKVLDDASPTVQVEINGAPATRFLVITRGSLKRQQSAAEFAAVINDKGGSAELLNVDPYTHMDVNNRLGDEGEQLLTPAVVQFISSCI